ncbi:MAG TPA: zinc-binding dehydrogenase [Terracidiphilus sp.]|jgi:NADPH2:quinone reductase
MIKPDDTALIDSAAGGVGLILTQLIKLLDGRVIGRVSTESKAEIARAAGAGHVLVTDGELFARDVVRFTSGNGVHVLYDGAGADTFRQSLASLSTHDVLAYYGQTIRRMPRSICSIFRIASRLTDPRVHDHVRTRDALLAPSRQLFDWAQAGQLKINTGHHYALADAAQAHRDLAGRRTTGKMLLLPCSFTICQFQFVCFARDADRCQTLHCRHPLQHG